MSSASPLMSRPQSHSHVIDNVVFDFGIHETTAPLNKVDFIKEKISDYLLPAVEQALDSFETGSVTIRVEEMRIDLGHFPKNTPWFTVRENLKSQLLNSLLSQNSQGPHEGGKVNTASRQQKIGDLPARSQSAVITQEPRPARIITLLDNLINGLNNITADAMPSALVYVLSLLRRHPVYLSLICQSQSSAVLRGLVKHLSQDVGAVTGSHDVYDEAESRGKDRDFWAQALREVVELSHVSAIQLYPLNSDKTLGSIEQGREDKAYQGITQIRSRAAKPKINSAALKVETTSAFLRPENEEAVVSDTDLQSAAFLINYLLLSHTEPSFKEESQSTQLHNLSTANENRPNIYPDPETSEEAETAQAEEPNVTQNHNIQAPASNINKAQRSRLGREEGKTYTGRTPNKTVSTYYQQRPINALAPNALAISHIAPHINFEAKQGLENAPLTRQVSIIQEAWDETTPQRASDSTTYQFSREEMPAPFNSLQSPNHETAFKIFYGTSIAPFRFGTLTAQAYDEPFSDEVSIAYDTSEGTTRKGADNRTAYQDLGEYISVSLNSSQPPHYDAAVKAFFAAPFAPLIFGAELADAHSTPFSGDVLITQEAPEETSLRRSDNGPKYHIASELISIPLYSSQSPNYETAFKLFYEASFAPLIFGTQPAHAFNDVEKTARLLKNAAPPKQANHERKRNRFNSIGPSSRIGHGLKVTPDFYDLTSDKFIFETKNLPSITELPSPVEGIGALNLTQFIPMNINIGVAISALATPILPRIGEDLIEITVEEIPTFINLRVIPIEQVIDQHRNWFAHTRQDDGIGSRIGPVTFSGAAVGPDAYIYDYSDRGELSSTANLDLIDDISSRIESFALFFDACTLPQTLTQSKAQLLSSLGNSKSLGSFILNQDRTQLLGRASNRSGPIVRPDSGMEWLGNSWKNSKTLFAKFDLPAFNIFNQRLGDAGNVGGESGVLIRLTASALQSPTYPISLFPMRSFVSLASLEFTAKPDLATALTAAPHTLEKTGELLRNLWHTSPQIRPISLRDYSGTELLTVLEAILPARRESGTAPLITQARKAMTLSKAPAELMQRIIFCCVDDVAIDISKISKALELEGIRDLGDTQNSYQGIRPNAGNTHQPSFTKSPDLPKIEGIMDRPGNASMIAEIEKAISLGSHELLEALAQANNRERKIALYLNLTCPEQRHAFVKDVGPLFYQRDFKILNQLWEALTKIEPDYRQNLTLHWEFILLCLTKEKSYGGGLSSLVEEALRHFESDPYRIKFLAGALLKYLLSTPYNPEGGISLELTNNLRSILSKDEIFKPEETIQVHKFTHTAGLVLLWPHFATLFKHLGLIEDRKFGSFEDQVKATNLLIYLSHGQSQELPQKHLYLERILCGIPPSKTLPEPETITPSEQELIDDMLRAVIGHWSALGTTSVEGLRESFIRRDGDIQETDESTILTVAPKAFDMLLDRLPWSIAMTKLAWMEKPLTVNWRN